MSLKFTTIPTKTLSESITSSATSFRLNNILGWSGSALTSADFGSVGYGVFRNPTNTVIELFEFDPSTIANTNITITRRGLKFDAADLTTEVSANKLSWNRGDTLVDLGTDTPQMLQWLKEYIENAAIVGGVPMTPSVFGFAKLSTAAVSPTNPIVVGDNDTRLPTQDENNAMVGDGGTPSSLNPFVTSLRTLNAGATINGATTPVPVYQNTTDNEVYPCDANDTATLKFIGFATTNSTDGNPISIKTTGVVSGFTGLTEGPYYVSDTAGTIQTTPGTNTVLVGWAISETELVIQKGSRYAAGAISSTISASGSQAITCGFRPSKINIVAKNVSSAPEFNSVDIVWVNGSIYGVSVLDNGASSISESSTNLYDNNNVNSLTFTITSVTDTGFTITWTEGGSYNILTNIIWSAQGDI